MNIRLLRAAVRDLVEAQSYIAKDDPNAAFQVGIRIDKAIELIGQRPHIGRPIAGQNVREWSVPGLPYLIPYRISGDLIEILRVWRSRREKPDRW